MLRMMAMMCLSVWCESFWPGWAFLSSKNLFGKNVDFSLVMIVMVMMVMVMMMVRDNDWITIDILAGQRHASVKTISKYHQWLRATVIIALSHWFAAFCAVMILGFYFCLWQFSGDFQSVIMLFFSGFDYDLDRADTPWVCFCFYCCLFPLLNTEQR